jgi:hypothetical protein
VTIGRKYGAFWSYTRFDDKTDNGWLTALREALMSEVQANDGSKSLRAPQTMQCF